MNGFKKTLLIGAVIASLGSGAFAAQGDQPAGDRKASASASGSMHKHDAGKHKERVAKRQAELHDKLKLNASQEAAWQAYIAASAPPAAQGPRPNRAEWEKLSAPERGEKMLSMMKQRQDHMAARVDAMKKFYAVLTPEQQKIFNDNVGKGHGRGHGRGHHGGR